MNLHACAKFGPDRTTGGDVYTVGRIHTHTDTHTLSYIDIDRLMLEGGTNIHVIGNIINNLLFIHSFIN